MSGYVEVFEKQLSEWNVALAGSRFGRLHRFAELLAGYDAANVVGERDQGAILLNHILDSLSCLLVRELTAARSIVDVGSGGGLPGIPLAIALPETDVTLLEATGKKAQFLRVVAGDLELQNAAVANDRAEDVGRREDGRERYDVATSRAVASLDVVTEYCMPLLRLGGVAVAMKGDLSEEELEGGRVAAKELGGALREVVSVPVLPELPIRRRSLVVVEKVSATSGKYPRRPGLARKRPLGGR